MLHPKINKIMSEQENCYTVVIAVAKRARQIAEKAEKEGVLLKEKPVSLAIKELEEGRLHIVNK